MEVVINGKKFPSIKVAAASIGICPQTLSRRMQLGLTGEALESAGRKYNATALIINGIVYNSMKEAADAYKVERRTIQRWIKQKKFNAAIIQASIANTGDTGSKPIVVNGVHYKSISAAANALNMPYSTLAKRAQKAKECSREEPIDVTFDPTKDYREKAVTIEGKRYATIKEAAEELGINYQTLVSRIKSGYYEKQAHRGKRHE